MKKYKSGIFIGFLVLVSLFYTWYIANAPQPLNWSDTYSPEGKNPYDTYITYHSLPALFPASKVVFSRYSIKEQLESLPESEPANYLFINRTFAVTPSEQKSLLGFVAAGNSLFVAAETMESSFLEALNLHKEYAYSSREHSFTRPELSDGKYRFSGRESYFVLDSLFQGVILGTLGGEEHSDFVAVPYGKGYCYLNLNPRAFTNFHVLDSAGENYFYKALSYLPDRGGSVVWDAYKTLGRRGESSLFRVILEYPALRWAFYLFLVGVLVWMAFSVRREQRPIPVVLPQENKMLDFVASVSSLYYRQKDHYRIAEKRIEFFLERIRSYYKIRTDELDENFIRLLAERSGIAEKEVGHLVNMINAIRGTRNVDVEKLRELVKVTERFLYFGVNKK